MTEATPAGRAAADPSADPRAQADAILADLLESRTPGRTPAASTPDPGNRDRPTWRRWQWWLPGIIIGVAFVASRVVSRWWGVRYDPTLLHHAWQLLDAELLDDHLWESAWYLHMQPPLFNIFVGGLLDLSPLTDATTLEAVWVAMGAGVTALVYDLLRQLGTGRWWAVVATIIICCGPGVVFYEAWFSYEMPVMLLLTATVDAVARWQRHGHLRALAAASGCAAAVVLTRSMLHPVWLVAIVAIALLARPVRSRVTAGDGARPGWPAMLLVAGLPILLVAGVVTKNQVLFGRTDMSSWMGWNLHRVVFNDMTDEEKQALVDDGTVSPAVLLFINQPYSHYEPELGPCEVAHPDVPALANETKALDPTVPADPAVPPENNLNNECYLRVYDRYQDDALAAVRARPGEYLRGVASAAQVWALPSTDYSFVRLSRDAVQPFETWYRHLVYLDIPIDPPVRTAYMESQLGCFPLPTGDVCWIPGGRYRFSLTIVAGTMAAVVLALRGVWRWARHGDRTQAVWVANGVTIGWVTATSILLELGENNRFRSVVEPLTLLTVAWLLGRLGSRLGSHLWARTPGNRVPVTPS